MTSWNTSYGPSSKNYPGPLPFNPAMFTTVCSWKKRAFVACRHRSEIWFRCLDIHSKL